MPRICTAERLGDEARDNKNKVAAKNFDLEELDFLFCVLLFSLVTTQQFLYRLKNVLKVRFMADSCVDYFSQSQK